MNGFGYTLAFVTGLLGAGHCLGMCSGLAGGVAVHQGWWGRLGPLLAYHATRIGTYVVLGAAGAGLGRVLVQSGWLGKGQGLLLIAAGLAIIALGLGVAGGLPWLAGPACRSPRAGVAPVRRLSVWRVRLLPVAGGLVNGMVPCSLVFSVAVKAAATADPLQAGLLMACFGLGTLPAMAAVTALGGWTGFRARGVARRLAGVAVVALGAWTVYEGAVFYQVMRGLAS